jgi:hypothetical protein
MYFPKGNLKIISGYLLSVSASQIPFSTLLCSALYWEVWRKVCSMNYITQACWHSDLGGLRPMEERHQDWKMELRICNCKICQGGILMIWSWNHLRHDDQKGPFGLTFSTCSKLQHIPRLENGLDHQSLVTGAVTNLNKLLSSMSSYIPASCMSLSNTPRSPFVLSFLHNILCSLSKKYSIFEIWYLDFTFLWRSHIHVKLTKTFFPC